MGDEFAKLIFFVLAAVAIIYLVVIVLAVSSVLLMIGLGLLSLYIVKSKRALVQETDVANAILLSATWEGALTVGMIVGSFGLIIAFAYALDPVQFAQIQSKYGPFAGFSGLSLFLHRWIGLDSYLFFVKATLLIYLTNRIFVRRQLQESHAILAVLPPIFGFVIFFVVQHWHPILDFLTGQFSSLSQLVNAFVQAVSQPFRIFWWAMTSPETAMNWASQQLIQSDGSLFRLARLFPEIFVILTIAFIIHSMVLFSGDISVDV